MVPDPSHVLALLAGAVGGLASVLTGVWLGFRVTTRDAALLARFATDAREAKALGELTQGQAKILREEWEQFAEQIERKRRSASTAAARAERAASDQETQAHAPPVALAGKERRRAIARLINGGH